MNPHLTTSEIEVLQALYDLDGQTDKVAEQRSVAVCTLKTQLRNIADKLHIEGAGKRRNRACLIIQGIKQGVITTVLLLSLTAQAEDRNVQLLRESVSKCVTIYQTCIYDGYYTPEQCLDGVPDEIRGLDKCCDEEAERLGFKKKERK